MRGERPRTARWVVWFLRLASFSERAVVPLVDGLNAVTVYFLAAAVSPNSPSAVASVGLLQAASVDGTSRFRRST